MKDEELILGLLLSYSMIVVNETKGDSRNSKWFKIAYNIHKVISKRKVPNFIQTRGKELLNKYNKCKELDMEYFKDTNFSAFVICLLLLDYAIKENRCLFTRSKLSHIDTLRHIEEVERSNQWRYLIKTHHRYITKLIENV